MTDFKAIWYQALASAHGVLIKTNDRDRCKQMLYRTRKELSDPALDQFSILTSPEEDHLFIVRKAPLALIPLEFNDAPQGS